MHLESAARPLRSDSGLSRNGLFVIELRSSQGQPLKYIYYLSVRNAELAYIYGNIGYCPSFKMVMLSMEMTNN